MPTTHRHVGKRTRSRSLCRVCGVAEGPGPERRPTPQKENAMKTPTYRKLHPALGLIVREACAGSRVRAGGLTIWAGLGNRAGLHDYAAQLTAERWAKSGSRFTARLLGLPAGTQLEVLEFRNTTRDRGRWVPVKQIAHPGPFAEEKPKGAKIPLAHPKG